MSQKFSCTKAFGIVLAITAAISPIGLAAPTSAVELHTTSFRTVPAENSTGPMSPLLFASSARGDLADMSKDLVDLQRAIDKGGLFRAVGNVLELSFNMGQLESLEPPTKISRAWMKELTKLEMAVEAVSSSVQDGTSTSTIKKRIVAVQSQIKKLDSLISKV